jgi:hypothetical protein
MSTACSLYVLLRRVSVRRGAGITGVVVWSVLLAMLLGPLGVGRVATLVVIVTFHTVSWGLQVGLRMSPGESCVIAEGVVVLLDLLVSQATGALRVREARPRAAVSPCGHGVPFDRRFLLD